MAITRASAFLSTPISSEVKCSSCYVSAATSKSSTFSKKSNFLEASCAPNRKAALYSSNAYDLTTSAFRSRASSSSTVSALPANPTVPPVESASSDGYGSRYTRPDRFTRLKRPSPAQLKINIMDWLEQLSNRIEIASTIPVAEVHDSANVPPSPGKSVVTSTGSRNEVMGAKGQLAADKPVAEGIDMALVGRHRALVQAGRLDECLELLATTMRNHPDRAAALGAHLPLRQTATLGVNHASVMIDALMAGNVELAFEYSGTLPASCEVYNLLMATLLIAEHREAFDLPFASARARGIALDRTSYGLLLRRLYVEARGDEAVYKDAASLLKAGIRDGVFHPELQFERLLEAVQF
eukprot:TRINITY_DN33612_c0_g1_i1.p1 TRINITY_DN33612_c0_g1~~TRINITY_DN33612_c0_g1_i1.p1  ORF type:complete len:354 (+),score=37.26 TRINITY_DN33612_c0_g1_i1:331-1392(+)